VRVAVIGAGVIGVTTAYELARDGHAVTVFERRGSVAEESSFANAGVIAPGYVTPWAAPGMPAKVLRYLFSAHSSVRLSLPLSAADLRWMQRWWRAARLERYVHSRRHMQRLAFYSRQRLHELSDALELEYDRAQGYTVLLRSLADAKMIEPSLSVLRDAGVPFSQLNEEAVRALEPALNPDNRFFGALHLPQDEVGNCRQFTQLLKAKALDAGVDFRFGAAIERLRTKAGNAGVAVDFAATDPAQSSFDRAQYGPTQTEAFDAAVVCAGVASAALLSPLGLKLPLAPVYGYSISAPIKEHVNAPRSALMDERYKVAISRLGQRVRVAGGAELGGNAAKMRDASIKTLYKVLHDWFPGAANTSQVQTWKGARPMLPDGPPVLGASGLPGIWLNLGHGSSGWALGCGSARVLADLMAGRAPEIDLTGFGVERLLG
jgi:D-amino-acid dehydrogenase